MKSDVMIQFGTGKMDFAAVFAALEAAGFDGPIMVECCKVGATAEETMANARANRVFSNTCSQRCEEPGGAPRARTMSHHQPRTTSQVGRLRNST